MYVSTNKFKREFVKHLSHEEKSVPPPLGSLLAVKCKLRHDPKQVNTLCI